MSSTPPVWDHAAAWEGLLIPISDIKIGERFRKELGDIKTLSMSIAEVGLLHPIVIDENKQLIVGYRRIMACRKIGWDEIPAHIVNLKDIIKGEFHENFVRKDFTVSEVVAIKRALEPKVREEAEKRMKAGKPCAESTQGGKSRDIVAKFAGVSHDTLTRAEVIVEAAEKNPERYGRILKEVDDGHTSINYAYSYVKRREKGPPKPLPEGRFDVILADPPWDYEFFFSGAPTMHYSTMPTEEISALKIPAAKDAILFLWATNPKLKDALAVMEAWGFEYKTNAVWVKDKTGTGYIFREKHELLLVGKKGKMPAPYEENRPASVIEAPRKEHSAKPDRVYEILERMYPGRKYLELFARRKREGWASWGEEVG